MPIIPPMENTDDLRAIETEGQRIIDLGRSAPEAIVPQYPSWTLRDLVMHVAEVHARTTEICRTYPQERVRGPQVPADRDVFDWAEGVLAEMVEALRTADLDTEVWTFVPDKRLAMWERRMVIETGVHRWDAEGANGDPEPLSILVAKHGLDEFEAQYLPRLGDVPAIELVDPELDRVWRYGEGVPVAILEGAASDHYLRLMSRPGTPLPPTWEEAVDSLGSPAER